MIYFYLVSSLHALLMLFDEFYFHQKRGLGKWESVGHPIDTLSVLICAFIAFFFSENQQAYILMSVMSCLLVTKDEWIHFQESSPFENWLHSILFILHPVLLYLVWTVRGTLENLAFLLLTFSFLIYQIIRWNLLKKVSSK